MTGITWGGKKKAYELPGAPRGSVKNIFLVRKLVNTLKKLASEGKSIKNIYFKIPENPEIGWNFVDAVTDTLNLRRHESVTQVPIQDPNITGFMSQQQVRRELGYDAYSYERGGTKVILGFFINPSHPASPMGMLQISKPRDITITDEEIRIVLIPLIQQLERFYDSYKF